MKNVYVIIPSVGLFICDQLIKFYSFKTLSIYERIYLLGKKCLTFTRVHNLGLIWGKYSNIPPGYNNVYIYYIPAACLLGLILVTSVRILRSSAGERISISLILSGGISNFFDHWRNGRVVDTFELYIGGGFYMPFNLADLGILFGFFGMTFYLLRDLLPLRSKLDVSPEW